MENIKVMMPDNDELGQVKAYETRKNCARVRLELLPGSPSCLDKVPNLD